MSNVKEVKIIGECPFTIGESHDAARFLAMMNSPAMGIRINYNETASRRNKSGGQTGYYAFTIKGQEAVSVEWVRELVQSLVNAGSSISFVYLQDIEDNNHLSHLVPVPKPGPVQFVMELVVQPGDAGTAFDTDNGSVDMVAQMQMKTYLDNHLIVDLEDGSQVGYYVTNPDAEEAIVSLATAGFRKR